MQSLRVLLVAVALGCVALAQELPDLVARLAKAESLDDEAVGDGGIKSETWRLYEQLRELATAKELKELTAHRSPVVRGYAVRALIDTAVPVDWQKLMLDHLADVEEVTTFQGCSKAKQKYGDVLFELLRPKLTEEQVLDLAEAFLRRSSPLYAREWALRNLRFRDGVLHLVRDLARRGEAPAAIALARYGLPPDVPVLVQHLQKQKPFDENAQFLAAAISKDPRLLPALLAIEPAAREAITRDNCSRLRSWLAAIAAQSSPEAAAFLLKFLQTTRPADPFKHKDLVKTYGEVLAAHAAAAVFEEVRAELKRRQAELEK